MFGVLGLFKPTLSTNLFDVSNFDKMFTNDEAAHSVMPIFFFFFSFLGLSPNIIARTEYRAEVTNVVVPK